MLGEDWGWNDLGGGYKEDKGEKKEGEVRKGEEKEGEARKGKE